MPKIILQLQVIQKLLPLSNKTIKQANKQENPKQVIDYIMQQGVFFEA